MLSMNQHCQIQQEVLNAIYPDLLECFKYLIIIPFLNHIDFLALVIPPSAFFFLEKEKAAPDG